MFNSPLEQFQILPLFSFGVNLFDFLIINAMIITCVGLSNSFWFYIFYPNKEIVLNLEEFLSQEFYSFDFYIPWVQKVLI